MRLRKRPLIAKWDRDYLWFPSRVTFKTNNSNAYIFKINILEKDKYIMEYE